MGVANDCRRHICDGAPREEHANAPLLILAHDDVLGKGKLLPHPAWDRGVDIGEERCRHRQLADGGRALNAWLIPVEKAQKVLLRRGGTLVWDLPPIRAREARVRRKWLDERSRPVWPIRVGVLAREDEYFTSGRATTGVPGAAVGESSGWQFDDRRAGRVRSIDAAV